MREEIKTIQRSFQNLNNLKRKNALTEDQENEMLLRIKQMVLETFPAKQTSDGNWIGNVRFAPGENGRKVIRKGSKKVLEDAIWNFWVDIQMNNSSPESESSIRSGDIKSYSGVYLITDGEYVKIGVAKNINNRINKLQEGNARRLKIIAYQKFQNAYRIENALHQQYREYRMVGEWFDILKIVRKTKSIENLLPVDYVDE